MNGLPVRGHETRQHRGAAKRALRIARGGIVVSTNFKILEAT